MRSPKQHTSAMFCDRCEARVLRASTDHGHRDLDPTPNAQGGYWAHHAVTGWRARLRSGPPTHPLERPYMQHTCTNPPDEGEDRG